MQYRELVKTVQDYSGFSDSEADEALRVFIETLSARLEGGEREDFASQLPSELKDLALSVTETINFNRNDLYQTVSELQEIEEPHARSMTSGISCPRIWPTSRPRLVVVAAFDDRFDNVAGQGGG